MCNGEIMRSIVRYHYIEDLTVLIQKLEALTRGKVVKIQEMFGEAYLTIEHHDGPICPECGKDIHTHGHGLCLNCWKKNRP
jgi:hypothetical protein